MSLSSFCLKDMFFKTCIFLASWYDSCNIIRLLTMISFWNQLKVAVSAIPGFTPCERRFFRFSKSCVNENVVDRADRGWGVGLGTQNLGVWTWTPDWKSMNSYISDCNSAGHILSHSLKEWMSSYSALIILDLNSNLLVSVDTNQTSNGISKGEKRSSCISLMNKPGFNNQPRFNPFNNSEFKGKKSAAKKQALLYLGINNRDFDHGFYRCFFRVDFLNTWKMAGYFCNIDSNHGFNCQHVHNWFQLPTFLVSDSLWFGSILILILRY